VVTLGVEAVDEALARQLDDAAGGSARLVLPPGRLRRLGASRTGAGILAMPRIDTIRLQRLSTAVDASVDAPVAPAQPLDEAALDLARLALILPAMLTIPATADDIGRLGLVTVSPDAIAGFKARANAQVRIVGRAPVPLENAPETEFVVFRGGEGLRDQVAIIVGKPDLKEPVHVRLHSACLTGDLFGSLKCDCGDQLRDTVENMAANGGGVLLYLDQEGRGNGIANKIKAYKLQSDGFDTFDADEILGFGLDQRRFGFAAEMLKQLGVRKVAVMSNNPEKIAALKSAGLDVVAEQRVFGRATPQNIGYLATKRDRAGHAIDLASLVSRGLNLD
jgi:GTP cyclohydrolase II